MCAGKKPYHYHQLKLKLILYQAEKYSKQVHKLAINVQTKGIPMEPNGDQRLVVGFNWLTLHNQISLSLTQERSRNDQIEKDKDKISNTGTWLQLIDWYESGSLIELLRLWPASRYESEAGHYMRVVHM